MKFLETVRVGTKRDSKVAKMAKMGGGGERTHGRRAVTRKEARSWRNLAREKPEHVGFVARQATLQRGVEAVATKHMYAIYEDGSANVEEATDNEERSASMVYVRRKRI